MKNIWHAGDHIVFRGIISERVWEAMSVIVIRDTLTEIILLLGPGAQCAWTNVSRQSRWATIEKLDWSLQLAEWGSNWFLMFLEPQKYYAISLIWSEAEEFKGYYINFQLPFRRNHLGFDSLDLELDLVVNERFEWHWKDEDDYLAGIQTGNIHQAWVQGVEQSKEEVLNKINRRQYPFDDTWLDWRPSSLNIPYVPPQLPSGWLVQ